MVYVGSNKVCPICKKKFRWYHMFTNQVMYVGDEKEVEFYEVNKGLYPVTYTKSIYLHIKCAEKVKI